MIIRRALFASILMFSVAGLAHSGPGIPSPTCSTVPSCITLVGQNGSITDPLGEFCVTVRDCNTALEGVLVVVDFSNCPGIQLCSESTDPDVTVDCLFPQVRKLTDENGVACFRIVGGGGGAAGVDCEDCATINAEGVLLGHAAVTAFDLDNAGGMGLSDLSLWLSGFLNEPGCRLFDLDCSGAAGPADLSLWLDAYFAGGSISSCPVLKCQ